MQVRRGTGTGSTHLMYVTSRQALAIGTRCPRLAGTCFRCTPPKRRSAHNWGALHCSRIEAQKGSEWTAARRLMGCVRPALTTSCAVT